MNIYVASSWRNIYQPAVVRGLRERGFDCYDFRHPVPGDNGFHWSEVDRDWKDWTLQRYVQQLQHPVAEDGFRKDFDAMKWAEACVLVLPCGRSAHLEAGWFVGQGRPCVVFNPREVTVEPELMNKMCTGIVDDLDDCADLLERELIPPGFRKQHQRSHE